jgi:hypothetical protein
MHSTAFFCYAAPFYTYNLHLHLIAKILLHFTTYKLDSRHLFLLSTLLFYIQCNIDSMRKPNSRFLIVFYSNLYSKSCYQFYIYRFFNSDLRLMKLYSLTLIASLCSCCILQCRNLILSICSILLF